MRKTVYICNHCGKNLEEMRDYIDIDIDDFDYYENVDLCKECYKEIDRYVKDFLCIPEEKK